MPADTECNANAFLISILLSTNKPLVNVRYTQRDVAFAITIGLYFKDSPLHTTDMYYCKPSSVVCSWALEVENWNFNAPH